MTVSTTNEPNHALTPGRWSVGSARQIFHAIVLSFALVTHFIVGFALVGPALGLDGDHVFDGSGAAIVMTLAQGVWGVGVVIGIGLFRVGRLRPSEVGWRLDGWVRHLALGAAGSIALVLVIFGPLLVAGKIDLHETLTTIGSFTLGQRAQIFLIGVLAAVTEETVFRGYLQPGLVARLGFPVGLGLTALIFGLYHFPMGIPPLMLGLKCVSGLVLGLVRGRDRSLIAPAFAHFTFWQLVGFA